MSHVHRLKVVLLLPLVAAVGCGGEGASPLPPVVGDDGGGNVNRTVIDASPDTTADGLGAFGDGLTLSDATGSTGDGGGTTLSVVIVSPKAGITVPARQRFTPQVDVTLNLPASGVTDTIMDVNAVVSNANVKNGPSAKLNQTSIDRTPESNGTVYHLGDTPVDLAALESGEYEMVVTARTVSGATAEGRVKFLVDGGPNIKIISPADGKAFRGSAPVNVVVTDDLFGPVGKVTMFVGQKPLMFTGPDANQRYTATVTFSDYTPILQGDQLLTVRAVNKNMTESVATRRFVADDKGPSIEDTTPAVGALIGRVITISARVTDPAGVLDSSVIAVIAHGDQTFQVSLPAIIGKDGVYSALFDTTRLPVNALYPSISFRASDILGNESSVGYLLSLDNTPPLADLDPPVHLRMAKMDMMSYACSWEFDPMGTDAINDLDKRGLGRRDGVTGLPQTFDVRARVEDQGNRPLTGFADLIPISGLDAGRVQLLVLNDTTQPLVVDTDNDGFCDAINPLLTPTTRPMSSKDALLINMVPVPPSGSADFTPDPSIVAGGLPCHMGTDTAPPKALCDTTDLSIAIPYTIGNQPAVWTIPPVVSDPLSCVGRQLDTLASSVADGWVCMAVAAADKLGNAQVSRPIRVCIDKDGKGGECMNAPAAPDCTGTQTSMGPPPVIDGSKPCKPWRAYANREIIFLR